MITLRFGRAANWISQVAAWVVVFVALGLLAVAVLVPRLVGATPYSIAGGSMAPTLQPGDLIVVRPTDPAALGVGAVITYQVESGRPTVATHRIVAMGVQRGEPVFQTRGDANESPDTGWVRPVQIKGEVWYHTPYLGHVHSALTGAQRQVLVRVAAGALLAYAAWMIGGAWRERRDGRRTIDEAAA
jgi:signal peptidase